GDDAERRADREQGRRPHRREALRRRTRNRAGDGRGCADHEHGATARRRRDRRGNENFERRRTQALANGHEVGRMKPSLANQTKAQLIDRILGKKTGTRGAVALPAARRPNASIPDALARFDRHPGYQKMLVPKAAGERLKIANPFFRIHDGVAGATTVIDGREYINFANYNYLGLTGHP